MRVYHAGAVKANLANSYHSQQGGENLYITEYIDIIFGYKINLTVFDKP